MKTIALLSILLLLAVACQTERSPLLEMSILTDSTDDIQPFSHEDVRSFLDYSNAELLWYEVSLRKRELTDVRYGRISESHLPVGQPNATTEQQRKLVVKRFLKQTEAMMQVKPFEGSKEQSHLYYGIADELNTLSKSKALHKIALISSNLLENTKAFSVYRGHDWKMLQEQPDSVIEIFNRELPLSDLTGIRVYIVYQATPEDHERFTLMSKLYQTMLSQKGASVSIAGNLIPETLTVP